MHIFLGAPTLTKHQWSTLETLSGWKYSNVDKNGNMLPAPFRAIPRCPVAPVTHSTSYISGRFDLNFISEINLELEQSSTTATSMEESWLSVGYVDVYDKNFIVKCWRPEALNTSEFENIRIRQFIFPAPVNVLKAIICEYGNHSLRTFPENAWSFKQRFNYCGKC